jgi:hypothetical protein
VDGRFANRIVNDRSIPNSALVELFTEAFELIPLSTMHKFFEEHPAILMEARNGIPISHPNFNRPQGWKPDFAISPILGPMNDEIELLELKGPEEKIVTRGFHSGFTAKVQRAIDQVRDYDRCLRDPQNVSALMKEFGYIPEQARLAVLIGRDPDDDKDLDTLHRRRGEVQVKVVTYDEILATQTSQLG